MRGERGRGGEGVRGSKEEEKRRRKGEGRIYPRICVSPFLLQKQGVVTLRRDGTPGAQEIWIRQVDRLTTTKPEGKYTRSGATKEQKKPESTSAGW